MKVLTTETIKRINKIAKKRNYDYFISKKIIEQIDQNGIHVLSILESSRNLFKCRCLLKSADNEDEATETIIDIHPDHFERLTNYKDMMDEYERIFNENERGANLRVPIPMDIILED